MRELMIDYRDRKGKIFRKSVDDWEFCVKNGTAVFFSNGERIEIDLSQIIQMYPV